MKNFKDWPIRRKLTVFIVFTALLAVVFLSSAFMMQRYSSFKDQISNEFGTITKIIADQSQAAIVFNDQKALEDTLNSLSLHADVKGACAFDTEGSLLAKFGAIDLLFDCPEVPPSSGIVFSSEWIEATEPIVFGGENLGLVSVNSSTERMKDEMITAFYIVLASSVIVVVMALLFALYIGRFVSDPLLELKDAAGKISLDNTYHYPLRKQNQDEVGSLVDAFNQMQFTISSQNAVIQKHTEELELKVEARTLDLALANEELKAFSYMVSHDLNQSIRVIKGFIDALDKDYKQKLDKDGAYFLERIVLGSRKMSNLITSLMSLAYANRQQMSNDNVNLTRLAEYTIDELRGRDPERDVQVRIESDMITLGDKSLIQVAMDNLIGNAWKYTKNEKHARIEVGQDKQNGFPVFYVKDNGAGFSMEYADLVTKPFERLHSEEDYEGSGIGMATVSRIIERHQGRLWFYSNEGAGSTFYFTLFSE